MSLSVEEECARLRLLIRRASRRLADLEGGRLPAAAPAQVKEPRRAKPPTSAVRAWARASGIPVGTHGRVPDELVDRYVASQEPAP